MKLTFLNHETPLLTTMVQADNPDRIKELIDKSLPCGAEAFGMQFCQMKTEYRTRDTYESLFSYAKDKPLYVTNYRNAYNEGKTDEQLAEEMLELADCGATLCDVMGDYFDKQPDEVAVSEDAIKKQMELIDALHKKGAEVLMSSHVLKFIPAERVLEIALEHQRRGADISKIVTGADTMEQQLENLRIVNLLKENLKIPFLFLASGECHILRRIGGELGCCMYLCVYEHDKLSTAAQPLLKNLKAIRDNMRAQAMEIIPLQYGKSVLAEEFVFINGEKNKFHDIVFNVYLIKTDRKCILVDAGCETMPGFVMRDFIGTIQALKNINVTPEEITDVLITHSHHDHIECVKYFKNAVIHIQEEEYEDGKKYIPDDFKVNIFKDEFSVCENVKIIKIGGHSKGSCIVEIRDDNTIYIISGDECYLRESLLNKIPVGSSCNQKASRDFIEKFSDSKYTVLLCHDK